MGTRLYPDTEDPAILEELAGVVPGTARVYTHLDVALGDVLTLWVHAALRHIDEDYIDRDWPEHPHQVLRYVHFVTFGFGKFAVDLGPVGQAQGAEAERVLRSLDKPLEEATIQRVAKLGVRWW